MTQATAKEAEAQHAEATATAIDSAGDLILELGQTDVKTHLRVSSKALALASPVFAAMVSSRFSEGNELAKGSLRPIPLPEDDPEAVTLLCNILHFRSRLVPARIPFPLLEKLALVCDKYDTAGAVTPWSTLWFQQWVGSLTGEDRYAKVLCLSYAYDNRKAFYEASSNFLQYTADSTVEDSMEGPSLVPDPLIDDLLDERKRAVSRLHIAIERSITPFLVAPTANSCITTGFSRLTCGAPPSYLAGATDIKSPIQNPTPGNGLGAQCGCFPCRHARTGTFDTSCSDTTAFNIVPGQCSKAVKIAAFFFELSRLGLWPLDENLRSSSLDTIFDQLSMFQDFTTNQAIAKCDTCSFSFKNKLADVVVQQRALLKGLCLSCAKHGRMNARAGNCQESQSCSVDETAFQAHRLKCARI